jgi:alkaline phosphatase
MSRGGHLGSWLASLALALAGCGDDAVPHQRDGAPPAIDAAGAPGDGRPDARPGGPAPAMILLIGDGMGPGQIDAASRYRHGAPGQLYMETLPVHSQLRSSSPNGITDSAAAATVMATGVYTWNYTLAIDRDGQRLETLVERAHARGLSAGVVTTTEITHATPAGFTAHVDSRASTMAIADQQARESQPEIMLGGGAQAFRPGREAGSIRPDDDDGLYDELAADGYAVITTKAELGIADAASTRKLVGLFGTSHLTYVNDRAADSVEPSLTQMAQAALTVLDRDPDGFFLMIEGGKIDHGGHARNIANVVHETLDFDDTVAAVHAWAQARGNVTIVVTADHECGGLEVVDPPTPPGQYPNVTWRWGSHTNARVPLFAAGPGAGFLDRSNVDHRHVYAVMKAGVDGVTPIEPAHETMPDGEVADLRYLGASQTRALPDDAGLPRLDGLYVDADGYSLTVGLEGAFTWDVGQVAVLLDTDVGTGVGVTDVGAALGDPSGAADLALSQLPVKVAVPGVAFDLAAITIGGADPTYPVTSTSAGLRDLTGWFGVPLPALRTMPAVVNFAGTRTRPPRLPAPVAGQGVEFDLLWDDLFPGGIPAGLTIALAAVQGDSTGANVGDQVLPSPTALPLGPGEPVVLDRVVVVELDRDLDGEIDAQPRVRLAPAAP